MGKMREEAVSRRVLNILLTYVTFITTLEVPDFDRCKA
jgi:hypothetical protein